MTETVTLPLRVFLREEDTVEAESRECRFPEQHLHLWQP